MASGLAATLPLDIYKAQGVQGFVRSLFRILDEQKVRYCVLHSWDRLPEELSSDLDLAVHPGDRHKLLSVIERLRKQSYICFQCLNHSVNGHFFVFCWRHAAGLKTVAVDLVFDHRRSGLILATSEKMVAGRQRHREFWIPSTEIEFAYLLAKKAWKGGASNRQSLRLRELVRKLGSAEAERIAGDIFPAEWRKRAVQACLRKSIAEDLAGARAKFWKTGWSQRPLQLIEYLAAQLRWGIRRCVQPTGILVAILGPDGVGKSTTITGLAEALDLGFWRRHRLFHWRPQAIFRKKDTGINATPHALPPRGALLSMAYLSAFFLDHWIGYVFVICPLLVRSNFILFDRYFHDVLVDPRRYRYGGPTWFSRMLSRLVPEPDLVIVLDADGSQIVSRKDELPLAEIERQREVYSQLRFQKAEEAVIKADGGAEDTLQSAIAAITEFMSRRLGRRMRVWKAANA